MSGEILPFDEHRRRRDEESQVRCAKCGRPIAATSIRCPYCCYSFSGVASSQHHAPLRIVEPDPQRLWLGVLAAVLLIGLVIAIAFLLPTGRGSTGRDSAAEPSRASLHR